MLSVEFPGGTKYHSSETDIFRAQNINGWISPILRILGAINWNQWWSESY